LFSTVAGLTLGGLLAQTAPVNKTAPKKASAPKAAAKKTAPAPKTAASLKKPAAAPKKPAAAPVKKPVAGKAGGAAAKKGATAHGKAPVKRGFVPRQTVPTADRYKEIQGALAAKGYLKSEPNGVWGAESVDAMKRFQADQKQDPTGKLTAVSLIGLGLGPKTASPEGLKPGVTEPPAVTTPPL
jgi:hypothetical protein